jgi:hypothetical protein
MSIHALRRDIWMGRPQQLGDLLLMRKGSLVATCELWTHEFGWECRLFAGEEVIATQVCRSQDDVFVFGEKWREALKQKGWT